MILQVVCMSLFCFSLCAMDDAVALPTAVADDASFAVALPEAVTQALRDFDVAEQEKIHGPLQDCYKAKEGRDKAPSGKAGAKARRKANKVLRDKRDALKRKLHTMQLQRREKFERQREEQLGKMQALRSKARKSVVEAAATRACTGSAHKTFQALTKFERGNFCGKRKSKAKMMRGLAPALRCVSAGSLGDASKKLEDSVVELDKGTDGLLKYALSEGEGFAAWESAIEQELRKECERADARVEGLLRALDTSLLH